MKTAWGRRHQRRFALVDGADLLASATQYRPTAVLDQRPVRVCGIGSIFSGPAHRGTGPAGHALTRTLIPSATKAGPFPPAAFFVATIRGLRSPRTSAAHDSTSPSAYTRRSALTKAAQTDLSCSVPLRAHVLRPIPRRDLPHHLRTETRQTWPSPRHDRLGSRVVNLSRLQASRHVAARVLASSVEAFDTPLEPPGSPPMLGVCYSALRRLPRRDLHPLETNSMKKTVLCLLLHDAPLVEILPVIALRIAQMNGFITFKRYHQRPSLVFSTTEAFFAVQ